MKPAVKWTIFSIILLPVVLALVILLVSWSVGDAMPGTSGKIGIVRISDIILDGEEKSEQLREFFDDASIAGVVVRINSPGGAVAPSQELYREMMRYRESGKPLVVSMDNIAASGGYYIASGAGTIFANPGTLTGSIGVIMRLTRYDKLFDKIGVDFITLKAGRLKDIGNPSRAMTPEERKVLESLLNDTHEQFIADVAAGRNIAVDKIRPVADGRIFTGAQALEAGLVDTLGTLSDALDYCKMLSGLPSTAKVHEKKPHVPLLKQLLSETMAGTGTLLRNPLPPSGIYYLFDPR